MHNASLIDHLQLGADFWFARDPQSTNWWFNELWGPQTVAQIFLLFQYNCTAASMENAVIVMNRFEFLVVAPARIQAMGHCVLL